MATRNLMPKFVEKRGESSFKMTEIMPPIWVAEYDLFKNKLCLLHAKIFEIGRIKSDRNIFLPEETDRRLNELFKEANVLFKDCDRSIRKISSVNADGAVVSNLLKRSITDLREEHIKLKKHQNDFLRIMTDTSSENQENQEKVLLESNQSSDTEDQLIQIETEQDIRHQAIQILL